MKKLIKKAAKKPAKKTAPKKVATKLAKKIAKTNHVKPVIKPKKVKKPDILGQAIAQILKDRSKTKAIAEKLGLDFTAPSIKIVFKQEDGHFSKLSAGVSHDDLKPEYRNLYSLTQFVYEKVSAKLTSMSPVVITVTAKNRRSI